MTEFKVMLKRKIFCYDQGDVFTVLDVLHVKNRIFYQLKERPPLRNQTTLTINLSCLDAKLFQPISDEEYIEIKKILSSEP